MKLLWDFTIQKDRCLLRNRPDIVCIDFVMNHCFFINNAISVDSRVLQKISEKQQRYSDLKIEVQKIWSYRASVAPIIPLVPFLEV